MRCRSPHCPTEATEGSRFCAEHTELFAAIRDEIAAGRQARLRSPGRGRRRAVIKSCAMPECPDYAKPGEPYCLHHLRTFGGGRVGVSQG